MRKSPSVGGALLDADGNLTFEPWALPDREPHRQLRVAVILDDFSRLALNYEWHQVEVTPSSWRAQLTERPVDLLFVESAWHGNGDAWQYHLTGTSAPRPALVELVQWCQQHAIPTVFWNKEDPAHYSDFLDTARLFDHVLTTDINRLDDYRRDLGHQNVEVLPFAAQPAIHNPVRPEHGHQSRDVSFGGMYFVHKYPKRREQMDMLLGAAHDVSPKMRHGLEIFSRYLGADEKYQFPAHLAKYVVGSLDYKRMLSAYRAYKVFLNVNSVVDSPSMCARRIFEITASGTPVLTTSSAAVDSFFPESEVPRATDRQHAGNLLRTLVGNSELRDRLVHRAQRRIWSEHTYAHRVGTVLRQVGLADSFAPTKTEVTALVSSNRPHQLDHVLGMLARQRGVSLQVLFLAHGWHPDRSDLQARARAAGVEEIQLLHAEAGVPLGECLNRLVAAAESDLVAKIDDDDFYGPYYLRDQINALMYSGADATGKQAHYVYSSEYDCLALRFPDREHKPTDFVMGPTLVAPREVIRQVPFPPLNRGEDSGFLRDLIAARGNIYSADRFNFVQLRGTVESHTWSASDAEILSSAIVQVSGPYFDHTVV